MALLHILTLLQVKIASASRFSPRFFGGNQGRFIMRYFLFVAAAFSLLVTGIAPASACPAGTHPVCEYNGGAHSNCHCQ
jgi:hypothetical protein